MMKLARVRLDNFSGSRSGTRPIASRAAGGGFLMAFGGVFSLFSLCFAGLAWSSLISDRNMYYRLQAEGVITPAEIIGQRIEEDDDSTTYYLTYRYRPHAGDAQLDAPYRTVEQSVAYSTFNALPRGAHTQAIHVSTDWSVVKLVAEHELPSIWVYAMFLSVPSILFVAGAFVIRKGYHVNTNRRELAIHGRWTTAAVEGRWTDEDSEGDTTYHVELRYPVLGESGEETVVSATLDGRAIYELAEHEHVMIVQYLPQKPDICHVYAQKAQA